jgi:hypothetical protein
LMTDIVEAALNVAFEYPSRRTVTEAHEASFDGICATARWPEPVGRFIRRGFRNRSESHQV